MLMTKDDRDSDRFFLSSCGKPIYNPSADLTRFHEKYNVPNITGQLARRVYKTARERALNEEKDSYIAGILSQTTPSAETHYSKIHTETTATASSHLSRLFSYDDDLDSDSSQLAAAPDQRRSVAAAYRFPKMDDQQVYAQLILKYPVTVDANTPRAKGRKSLTGTYDRVFYDRWRSQQQALRVTHILSHFARRQPTQNHVEKFIERQGWETNIPKADTVLSMWTLQDTTVDIADSPYIRHLVETQKWKGLTLATEEDKGECVFTSRPFKKGEVVCDYHGIPVSRKAGLKLLKISEEGAMGHLFFFKNSQSVASCIDAQTFPCPCHPQKDTFGRCINHSRVRSNLQPRTVRMEISGDLTDVIVFLAKHDIPVNTELLFDYGVKKSSLEKEHCWIG
ncbi:uncharacterized protein LOC136718966 [Amia ocellicauda]|uniref:uncharacterized protein LOC136718966 n=1 Tax=Amia ocellicauda TaxID=2972642 RepID=UPI00346451A3